VFSIKCRWRGECKRVLSASIFISSYNPLAFTPQCQQTVNVEQSLWEKTTSDWCVWEWITSIKKLINQNQYQVVYVERWLQTVNLKLKINIMNLTLFVSFWHTCTSLKVYKYLSLTAGQLAESNVSNPWQPLSVCVNHFIVTIN